MVLLSHLLIGSGALFDIAGHKAGERLASSFCDAGHCMVVYFNLRIECTMHGGALAQQIVTLVLHGGVIQSEN